MILASLDISMISKFFLLKEAGRQNPDDASNTFMALSYSSSRF